VERDLLQNGVFRFQLEQELGDVDVAFAHCAGSQLVTTLRAEDAALNTERT
jgi:hypothetical protein